MLRAVRSLRLPSSTLLVAVAAVANATPTVEQWRLFETSLQGPSSGNPFVDVQLNATFTLATAAQDQPQTHFRDAISKGDEAAASKQHARAAPTPLVSLDFSQGNASSVPNTGSSSATAPSGQIISASRSNDVPEGSSGASMSFGVDTTVRHVVEVPGDKKPFEGGIAGSSAAGFPRLPRQDGLHEVQRPAVSIYVLGSPSTQVYGTPHAGQCMPPLRARTQAPTPSR